MDSAWMVIIGLFVITAFVTYGVFANINYARREADSLGGRAVPESLGHGRLSTKLDEELNALTERGESVAEWLKRTRVPYGQCLSQEDCAGTTRCVQCDSFEGTEQDVPALERLLAQELEFAEVAATRGMNREAGIHRSIAKSVAGHLEEFRAIVRVA